MPYVRGATRLWLACHFDRRSDTAAIEPVSCSTFTDFSWTIARVRTRPNKYYPNLFCRRSLDTLEAENKVASLTAPMEEDTSDGKFTY